MDNINANVKILNQLKLLLVAFEGLCVLKHLSDVEETESRQNKANGRLNVATTSMETNTYTTKISTNSFKLICNQFEITLENLVQKFCISAKPKTEDEEFVENMLFLIKDLPENIQVDFKLRVVSSAHKLRSRLKR